MTQEEVGKEYSQAAGALGERVYRFFVPLMEMHQILSRMLYLNQEAWKLKEAEKKTAPAKTVAAVEGAPV